MNKPPWKILPTSEGSGISTAGARVSRAAPGLSEVTFAMSFLSTVADIFDDSQAQTGRGEAPAVFRTWK
jgi:hypothetical protein